MTWFERIKGFYEKGLWSKEWVADAVVAKKITAEEYEIIVGDPYPNE